MRIHKIQNSNFNHSNDKSRHAQTVNADNNHSDKPAKPSTSRELVVLQPTEYKRFNSKNPHSSNPFLAQYISQTVGQTRRAFIGRKPAWQAKTTYENSANILKNTSSRQVNMSA
ncbi:MAG: hypothetical protein COB24_10510 [Hyphomicrobiales bacterium]|nr:MAG: hypothetical protein COB24_10510 [Hyphomicrobiales bacterium]